MVLQTWPSVGVAPRVGGVAVDRPGGAAARVAGDGHVGQAGRAVLDADEAAEADVDVGVGQVAGVVELDVLASGLLGPDRIVLEQDHAGEGARVEGVDEVRVGLAQQALVEHQRERCPG